MYDCNCSDCKSETVKIDLSAKAPIKRLLNDVSKAFKRLHDEGKYDAKDLFSVKEYEALLNGTNAVLSGAISDNDIPAEMLSSLQQDVFVFSALKTHAQLLEASRLLLTEDGKVKPFYQFSKDVDNIKSGYNQNYLEAEYQFAITSSQMAGKWAQISSDYDLQYRTASDDRVRESHRVLHNVTLPPSDAFWLSYYPPNGWRCRCNAVEVRKGKYDISNSAQAIEAGEKATTQIGADGKNKLAIFRFNPGAEKKVFPPEHPYQKVTGAATVRKKAIEKVNPELAFKPQGIDDYAKNLGVKINDQIFGFLGRETKFYTQNPIGKTAGAYFHNTQHFVVIPIDERRKRSKWKAESVVYHEFGHAADWQKGLKKTEFVADVMEKYRKGFRKNTNERYKLIERHIDAISAKAYFEKDHDTLEQAGAVSDTLMALNKNFGSGHSKAYFAVPGMSEAEFIAHAFENRFAGNEVFKKVAPDLYEDMIKLTKDFETIP